MRECTLQMVAGEAVGYVALGGWVLVMYRRLTVPLLSVDFRPRIPPVVPECTEP